MRLIFAGTPEPAVVALGRLLRTDHEVVAVLTRPDARRGRGRTLHPSPVSALAQEHGIVEVEERRMIQSVFDLASTTARQVMVPRTEMIWIEEGKHAGQAPTQCVR